MGKQSKIEITEMFMVKSGWDRTFVGVITRTELENGTKQVHGAIPVNDCIIRAVAENQDDLGEKLDTLLTLLLDHNIHDINPKLIRVGEFVLYQN